MTNKEIARALKQTGALIEITGGNAFRSRAFENAARTIERMEESAEDLLREGELTKVRGIGDGLAAQITELLDRGSFELRDELLREIPAGVLAILKVKGLGAKKVRALWQERGITSIEALEAAARAGHLDTVSGFGAKTQAKILEEIGLMRHYSRSRRFADAYALALPLLEALDAAYEVTHVQLTGEMRRRLEIVDAVEIFCATEKANTIPRLLGGLVADGVEQDGVWTYKGQFPDGFPLQVTASPHGQCGSVLWRTTGSEAHVEAFIASHGEPPKSDDEEAVYAHAGLPVIPPELREGSGELEAAGAGRLPVLIRVEDLKGSLHNHSTYSDGAHRLEEMVRHARSMDLAYYGVCDHSRSLVIANGLSVERVRDQKEEIQALNAKLKEEGGAPFRIFSGTESDILTDGSLDYPDEVLAAFDFVVASVHSGFNMTRDEATARLLTAIQNPYTSILGHATGRLLLAREGYEIDHLRVIEACAANGVAIELNADPSRLDMDWRWIKEATSRGVLISINPDAHSMEGLSNVRWGVQVARKGWLTAADCLNAKTLHEFETWLNERRTRCVA